MKAITFLLAATVLVLAVKPGIDSLFLQLTAVESCCHGSCKPFAEKEKVPVVPMEDDCQGTACNPFQVCCSGVLHCLAIASIELSKTDFSATPNFTYQSVFSSLLSTEFWQPPRIV